MSAVSSWINYTEHKPPKEGPYEWRMPSKGTPGVVIVFAACMRLRNAGWETVVSPSFDYWDGYRLNLPEGIQWRETTEHASLQSYERKMLAVEGLDIAPCPYCGKVPSFETAGRGYHYGADPHDVALWSFKCCGWAKTPWMDDPRKIEAIRRKAFAVAAEETP